MSKVKYLKIPDMKPDLIVNMENLTFEFPSAHGRKPGLGPGHWTAEQWKALSLQFEELKLNVNRKDIKKFLTRENLSALALEVSKKLVTNVYLRAISSYIISFLGILSILSWQNPIPWNISAPVAGMLAVAVSAFFTFSVTFRCVLVLSLPEFTTQQGRFTILFLVTALTVGGPVVSLVFNGNQVAYSMSCMANMTVQQGKAMTDSYREAYEDVTNSLNRTVDKIKKAKASTDQKLLQHIDQLHQKIDDLKMKVLAELDKCDSIMGLAREDCMYRSSKAFHNCVEVTQGLKLNFLCELVKIAPGICNGGFKGLCLPVTAITMLATEVNKLVEQMQESFRFKLNYENNLNNNVNTSLSDTSKIQQNIKNHFQDFCHVAVALIRTFKYILFGAIFYIPVKSWIYLRRFRRSNATELSFLDRFPVLDERQRQRQFLHHILILCFHFICILAIFGCDWLLYGFESTVEQNGNVNFETEAEYGFKFDMNLGEGHSLMNPFFDSQELFESLDMEMRGRHKFFTSTISCLPKPMTPSCWGFIFPVIMLYATAIWLMLKGSELLERRGDIITYFFPDELQRHSEDLALIPF